MSDIQEDAGSEQLSPEAYEAVEAIAGDLAANMPPELIRPLGAALIRISRGEADEPPHTV